MNEEVEALVQSARQVIVQLRMGNEQFHARAHAQAMTHVATTASPDYVRAKGVYDKRAAELSLLSNCIDNLVTLAKDKNVAIEEAYHKGMTQGYQNGVNHAEREIFGHRHGKEREFVRSTHESAVREKWSQLF